MRTQIVGGDTLTSRWLSSLADDEMDRPAGRAGVAVETSRAGAAHDSLAEARRSVIMGSTEHLIAVHGYDALRLRDVAQHAGVSIGLIQHYFDTRDDLLRETMREASRRRAQQWTDLASKAGSGRDKLTALLGGAIHDRHRCAMWIETCAAATRHDDLRSDVQLTQNAWRAAVGSAIEEGVRAGQFVCVVPLVDVVALLISLIDGLMLATAAESDDPDSRANRIRILQEAANRLLPPPAGDTPA